jgi:hypothetical protein
MLAWSLLLNILVISVKSDFALLDDNHYPCNDDGTGTTCGDCYLRRVIYYEDVPRQRRKWVTFCIGCKNDRPVVDTTNFTYEVHIKSLYYANLVSVSSPHRQPHHQPIRALLTT